jgi:hypothetical protein
MRATRFSSSPIPNTIPALLKLWGHAAAVEVGKQEFNSLWLVVPRDGRPPVVSRLKL